MRDILFRAKRIDNGEWVEGLPSYNPYDGDITEFETKDCGFIGVDPETVCQYTGLTDKNGKRYENDIFQADNGVCTQIYIIMWDEYSLQWSAECIGDPDGTLPLCEFRTDKIDVIGNIFDNPELLGNQELEGRMVNHGETDK